MGKKISMPTLEDADDLEPMRALMQEKSDHVAIIVGASYLDASLSILLQHHLLEGKTVEGLLDPVKGALGTFNAKASMCYVLGLITKEHMQDVLLIAEIRNYCAHDWKIKSFDDPILAEMFGRLKWIDIQLGKGLLDDEPMESRFKMIVMGLANDAHFVARRIPHVKTIDMKKFVTENIDKRFDLPEQSASKAP